MIGQHIYSRCTQGYYGISSGDSTTVTITSGLFPIKEQEKTIARTCEKIAFLEDTRKAPSVNSDSSRGLLKIFRLNDQILIICRSRRIGGSSIPGAKDFRDFTYSISYILTGDDKNKFFQNPASCLNLDNYEPYSSVQKRMDEYALHNSNGYISPDENYSIFNGPNDSISLVFEELGFTKDTLNKYIYAIISAVISKNRNIQSSKIYVVMPRKFRLSWDDYGGNIYAEKLLLATYEILPSFISCELSGISGGHITSKKVIEPYQLIISEDDKIPMDAGNGFVIDLQEQATTVDFTFRNMSLFSDLSRIVSDKEYREKLDQNYQLICGNKSISVDKGAQSLLGLVIQYTNNTDILSNINPIDIINICSSITEDRTDTMNDLLSRALEIECRNESCSNTLTDSAINLYKNCTLSDDQKILVYNILFKSLFADKVSSENVKIVSDIIDADPENSKLVISDILSCENGSIQIGNETLALLTKTSFKYSEKDPELVGIVDQIIVGWIKQEITDKKAITVLGYLQNRSKLFKNKPIFKYSYIEVFTLMTNLLNDDNVSIRCASSDLLESQLPLVNDDAIDVIWDVFINQFGIDVFELILSDEYLYTFLLFALLSRKEWISNVWGESSRRLFVKPSSNQFEQNMNRLLDVLVSEKISKKYKRDRLRYISELTLNILLKEGKRWFHPTLQNLEPSMKYLNDDAYKRDARLGILFQRYDSEISKDTFLVINDGMPQLWEIIFESIRRGCFLEPLKRYAKDHCESRKCLIDTYKTTSLCDSFTTYQNEIMTLSDVYYSLFLEGWEKERDRGNGEDNKRAVSYLNMERGRLNDLDKRDQLYGQISDRLKNWANSYPEAWNEFQSDQKSDVLFAQKENAFGEITSDKQKRTHYENVDYWKDNQASENKKKKVLIICLVGCVAIVLVLIVLLLYIKNNNPSPKIPQTEKVLLQETMTEAGTEELWETEAKIEKEQALSEKVNSNRKIPNSSEQNDSQLIDQSDSNAAKVNNSTSSTKVG